MLKWALRILIFTVIAVVGAGIYDYKTNRLGLFRAGRAAYSKAMKLVGGDGKAEKKPAPGKKKNEFTDEERKGLEKILETK